MKIILSIFCYLIFSFVSNSQNLIPNSGFEDLTYCSGGVGKIYLAPPWFQPCIGYGNTLNSSSCDLFDTCSSSTSAGNPINFVGHQSARTGIAYAGIISHAQTLNYREYIEVPLISTLINGKSYCLQLYVSLAENSIDAISNIGAYFSSDSLLDGTHNKTINYVSPQIENPLNHILLDTVNWILISGSFIANGDEKFITIGNFHLPAATNVQSSVGGSQSFSYYYIDDISLIDCEQIGIEEQSNSDVLFYPNPAKKELKIKNLTTKLITINFYSVAGELIKSVSKNSYNNQTINIDDLETGIYFIDLLDENGIVRRSKIVKMQTN